MGHWKTQQSSSNRADASAHQFQLNTHFAIKQHATSLQYTNFLVHEATLPTSAEITLNGTTTYTIGQNTTVGEMFEQLGTPPFIQQVDVIYNQYGDDGYLYTVYFSDSSEKAISAIWHARPASMPPIPINGGKISIQLSGRWGQR
jgi:hypothetical protein